MGKVYTDGYELVAGVNDVSSVFGRTEIVVATSDDLYMARG